MRVKTIHLKGKNTGKYGRRIDRSLCWLGDTDAEQKQHQQLLVGNTQWIVLPREFFYRPDPPQLLFSVTAFWENVPYPIAPTEVAT